MEAALRNDLGHTEFCLGPGGLFREDRQSSDIFGATSGVNYTTTQNVGGHRSLSDGTNITEINYSDCTCFPMIDSQGS